MFTKTLINLRHLAVTSCKVKIKIFGILVKKRLNWTDLQESIIMRFSYSLTTLFSISSPFC